MLERLLSQSLQLTALSSKTLYRPSDSIIIKSKKILGKVSMKLWDLGGQARFRQSWEKFCRDSDVIIFVVDSYDQTNIDVARAQMHQLLQNKSLAGIPLLVLGNKNDIQGSLKQSQVIDRMELSAIKDRTVACFSVSAKSQNRLDVMLKWLSDLKTKK